MRNRRTFIKTTVAGAAGLAIGAGSFSAKPYALSLAAASVGPSARSHDWPQWRGPQRDGELRQAGLLEAFAGPEIRHGWSVEIGSGYSGPVVAEGRVYVTDRVTAPAQMERVHAFRTADGERIWSYEYSCPYVDVSYTAGPRASMLVDQARAYSLGTMGHLHCFDAATGELRWMRDLNEDYRIQIQMPMWGIAAAPLVERDLIILLIGGQDGCVVALDRRTGRERWTALNDSATYSAPIVIEQNGRRVVVAWTAQRVVGLDPVSGTLLWEYPFPYERWPIAIATPVRHRQFLLLSEAHQGTRLLRTPDADEPAVAEVWRRRAEDSERDDALHCLISTPYISDGYIYGVDGRGILRCLELESGRQIWMNDAALPTGQWATTHLIPSGERTWLFSEHGELIIARLEPHGYREIGRSKLLEPTTVQLPRRGGVTWSHPAFAQGHVFARNDERLVSADVSAHGPNAGSRPGNPHLLGSADD